MPQRVLISSLFFELRKVRSEIDRNGWDEELVDRVLTSIRIVGALINGKRIAIRDGQSGTGRKSGEMLVRVGIFRNRKCFVSASETNVKGSSGNGDRTNSIADDVLSERLADLLLQFTKVRYARESEVFPSNLTETLEEVQYFLFQVARRLFSVNQWIRGRFNTAVRSL